MGFFSKNKKYSDIEREVPESIRLPELPSLPPLPQESMKMQGNTQKPSRLPSLPSSKNMNNLNQSIVKENISSNYENQSNDEDSHEDNYNIPTDNYPPMFQRPRAVEYDSYSPQNNKQMPDEIKENMVPSQFQIKSQKPSTFEMSSLPRAKRRYEEDSQEFTQMPKPTMRPREPLFVKLDKVENTISALNEIKLRISEIDTLLRNLKEIKMKEETELREWERELETIKTRLDQIDKDLFKGIGDM